MHTPNHSLPHTLSCARALFPLELGAFPHPKGYATLSDSLSLSLSYFSELETRTPLTSAAVSESTSAAASQTTSLQSSARKERGHAEALQAVELELKLLKLQQQGVPMYAYESEGQLHGQQRPMPHIPTQQVAAQPKPEMMGVGGWGQVPELGVHITPEHQIAQLKALLEEKEALLSRLQAHPRSMPTVRCSSNGM